MHSSPVFPGSMVRSSKVPPNQTFPCHEVVKNILQSPPFLLIFRSSDMQDLWTVALWSHYLLRCRILQGQVPAQFGRPCVLRQGTENAARGKTYLLVSSGRAARNVLLETARQGNMAQENSASLQQAKKPTPPPAKALRLVWNSAGSRWSAMETRRDHRQQPVGYAGRAKAPTASAAASSPFPSFHPCLSLLRLILKRPTRSLLSL